jgi:hypothetical protein
LNLQAQARWVINLDLPWNPARLEQRAGRVDRIGQRRAVHVTLLIARHPSESTLLERLARRTLLARAAMGTTLLAGALPDRMGIRDEVLLGGSPESPAIDVPDVTIDRTWTRRARAATRVLSARRQLASRWRTRTAPSTGTAWADMSNVAAIRALASPCLLVFIVPVLDRAGEVVEEHIVAVRASDPMSITSRDALVDAASAVAGNVCRARARRVAALRMKWAQRASAIERGICDYLTTVSTADEAQPGLFDRRAIVTFDRDRVEVEEIQRLAAERVVRYDDCGVVAVGKPQLVFLLRCRR